MTTILHISSSSNLSTSVTRQIGSIVVNELEVFHSAIKIIERDLVKNPVPHINPEFLDSMFSDKKERPELLMSNQLIDELLASDIIVIEAPMYNFGIPSVLKAWIDHIARSGKTFKYTASGSEGLAIDKKAILILGRGGIYSEGANKALDYQESYLRSILGFIGITYVESVVIEGVAMGAEIASAALENAKKQAFDVSRKVV